MDIDLVVVTSAESPGEDGRLAWVSETFNKKDLFCHLSLVLGLQVALMFPSTEIQLLISSSTPPRLLIQPSGLLLHPAMETQAFVVLPNSSLVPLFLLLVVSWVGTPIQAQILRLHSLN